MAAADPTVFLRGFAETWAELKRDQEVDAIAVAMGVFAAVKALAPLGVQGFKMFKGMTGGSDEVVQERMNQVNDGSAGPSGAHTESSPNITTSPILPRVIQFESPKAEPAKLTPEHEEQYKKLQQKREKYKIGLVDCQVQRYERRQPPRPQDDDHDQLTRQRDKLQQEEEQEEQDLFAGVVANRGLGKAAAFPQGVPQEDATPDSWQGNMDEKSHLQQSIRTKDARLKSMEVEMRRMQKEMEDMKKNGAVQPIPLRQDISTPPIPRRDNITLSFPIITPGFLNKRQPNTPHIISSGDGSNVNGSNDGLFRVIGGDGDGGCGGDNDFNGEGYVEDNDVSEYKHGYNTRRGEFMLVKASNITVATFTGTNLTVNPYLQFYKAMRRLIYSQGEDGEFLLKIITEIGKKGSNVFIDEQLEEEIKQRPKVSQFNRAILTALLNYTAGIARGMVDYGVENGFDAWRKFYHHHMPLAEALQQLRIQELYAIRPVTENTIDSLLNKVERITELYTRHGAADDQISDKWIKAAVVRNLPKHIIKDLAIQFKDAKTTGEVRHIVNIYTYIYIYARLPNWHAKRTDRTHVMRSASRRARRYKGHRRQDARQSRRPRTWQRYYKRCRIICGDERQRQR